MSKRITDIIPKIPQYEDIPYAADLKCQNCGESGFLHLLTEAKHKPELVGWTETNNGFQGIFKCTCCGEKFRFHCASPASSLQEFIDTLEMDYLDKCSNGKELDEQVNYPRINSWA